MSDVRVAPMREHGDYTGRFIISLIRPVTGVVNAGENGVSNVTATLELDDMRTLFGQAGDALKQFDANSDPS